MLASGIYNLARLVEDAYRNEVDGFDLPQWPGSLSFAVNVSIPPNTSIGTCQQMLRNLLSERFHMVTAMEARDVERYYLKLAKSGLKLEPVSGPPADPNASVKSEAKDGLVRYTFRAAPASRVFSAVTAAAILDARRRSLRIAGIVDETGLTGYYDGELEFTLPSQPAQSPLPESLEEAIARQLGLTLELRKVPGKILVLRSADRMPTEN